MQRNRRDDDEQERYGYEGRGRRDDERWRGHEEERWRGRESERGGMFRGGERDERYRGMDREREGREGWRGMDMRGMDRDREEGRWRHIGRDWERGGRDEDWRRSMEDRDMWRGQMGGMGQDWRRMGIRRDTQPGGGQDWRETEPYQGQGTYGGGYGGGYGGERWQGGRSGYGGEGRYGGGYGGEGRYERDRDEDERGGFMGRVGEGIRRFFGGEQDDRGPHYGKGPRGYRRSDERIREDVCERLSDSPWVDASEVDVRVQDAEVTLTGTVQDRREKRMMEDIVERIPGVKDVHNQIRVERERRMGRDDRPQSQRSS